MVHIAKFTFNPFSENTYVLHDGQEAIIVDPGCCDTGEQHELGTYLVNNGLEPVRLVLTHAHIDHVLGCTWVHERFGLLPELHRADLRVLEQAVNTGILFGVPCDPPPAPERFIEEGDVITLGDARFEVLFVPGHSPGHIALWCADQRFIISGDVLFQRSIGRTDLPGGDMGTLLSSIRNELFPLGDDVKVYCGHGLETTIGEERLHNPFLR